MPSDALLDLLDPVTKSAIFTNSLKNLQVTPQLNLDALRICLQLASTPLPLQAPALPSRFDLEGLWDKVIAWIELVQGVPEDKATSCLYQVADTCLSSEFEVAHMFHDKLYNVLESVLTHLQRLPVSTSEERKDRMDSATAYLRFLQHSFWLPPDRHHLIYERTIPLLSEFIGYEELEDIALDALSALFSLLKGADQITLASSRGDMSLAPHKLAMCHHESFWEKIDNLDLQYRNTYSSKICKVWFQWISQIRLTGSPLASLQSEAYWHMLSDRLLSGFAEEQKYCLGIINQSLLLAQEPIFTNAMEYHGTSTDREAYEHYTTLFRTIVLNRYTNQVAACLPELTTLFGPGSRITSVMTASLISAALHSRVQEGVRKLIGYWYIDHALKNPLGAELDGKFLTLSFLPWATEGSLYTSSIKSTRTETVCLHGDTIANVLARLVSAQYITDSSREQQYPQGDRAILLQVIRFIQRADGKIFQPAILYLLEGLVRGLEACVARSTPTQTKEWLKEHELAEIMKVSRLPGLPEISSDLLTAYCQHICALIRDGFISLKPCDPREQIFRLSSPVDEDESNTGLSFTETCEPVTIEGFVERMKSSRYSSIQGDGFVLSCKNFITILDRTQVASIPQEQLLETLHAFWEEAERCEFGRQVAMHLPPVLFHPSCIEVCIEQHHLSREHYEDGLEALLSKALLRLQQLSQGRSYILSVLATSVRKAIFSNSLIASILPFEDFIIEYLNNPPASKPEFLFEVAAAGKLGQLVPDRSYTSYYGQREWHAYAALIDLLRRWPEEQAAVAKNILSKLVNAWRDQKIPVPIKSPWKTTLQLQVMLIFSDFCISESDVDSYLDSLTHALSHESWPRYRYLLEWIIARIYNQYQTKTSRILDDLARADQFSPAHIASLIKLGLLVAPSQPESFAFSLLLHLVCFSASPKVHIRHEANFAFPVLFDLAEERAWSEITHDATFVALNKFIRQLAKYHADPWTIRTLRLDAVRDFCLVNIFQGRYLTIESPERERAAYEDFVALEASDHAEGVCRPPSRVLLGDELEPVHDVAALTMRPKPDSKPDTVPEAFPSEVPAATPVFLQTKAGFDIESLYPPTDSPFAKNQRPATVIVVASLIDNPTNLGGLSRISESFGLEALYIDDLKKTAHKDFKATSVTSEKHFPIRALKIPDIPQFLVDAKRRGYEVVGVEQTDRSGILGEDHPEASCDGTGDRSRYRKDLGTLPKQCVLVLGSEKGGITPEVLAVIDRCVEIRTVGVTRSLNVQTAGGIAVYEWWREWGGKN